MMTGSETKSMCSFTEMFGVVARVCVSAIISEEANHANFINIALRNGARDRNEKLDYSVPLEML